MQHVLSCHIIQVGKPSIYQKDVRLGMSNALLKSKFNKTYCSESTVNFPDNRNIDGQGKLLNVPLMSVAGCWTLSAV